MFEGSIIDVPSLRRILISPSFATVLSILLMITKTIPAIKVTRPITSGYTPFLKSPSHKNGIDTNKLVHPIQAKKPCNLLTLTLSGKINMPFL